MEKNESLSIAAGPLIQMAPLDVHSQDDNDNNGPEAVEEAVQTLQASNEGTVLMDASKRVSHCPPGLLSLNQFTHLSVHKEEQSECDCYTKCVGGPIIYSYVVRDHTGRKMFSVREYEDCCQQQCCGLERSFTLRFTDITGCEAITLRRLSACNFGSVELMVHSGPGSPIGYAVWSSCCLFKISSQLSIQNERRETVLKMAGETCMSMKCCGSRIHFQVSSLDGTIIGDISTYGSKLQYDIQLPLDLDVKLKAVILGACVSIDIMLFGKSEEGILCEILKVLKCSK
ncbi:phospholipid scramblase 1-like isoform X2 [Sardina pilchardus]|uniref:phospholipid scramblase 1-like isoform X2 n=1 Tax=Sardina pilchardus TaxID=27697 RepID=UPI002E165745